MKSNVEPMAFSVLYRGMTAIGFKTLLGVMTMIALKLLKDESGFLVAGELILVSTILTLGMIVGLTAVRSAVVNELNDVADGFFSVNQGHRYDSLSNTGKIWGDSAGANNGGIDIAGAGY